MYNKYDPQRLKEFIGQTNIVADLAANIKAAKSKKRTLEHTLFAGGPGLGKSTIARIIAKEMGSRLHEIAAATLTDFGQLNYIIYTMKEGDVIFVDEIHRLKDAFAESMYTLLESGIYNRVKRKPFTLVGATNYAGDINKPLRERFVHRYVFLEYSTDEMVEILKKNGAPSEVAKLIAMRSRGIPRIARHYLVKANNQAESLGHTKITPNDVIEVFTRLEIDENGLTKDDLGVLNYLMQNGATDSKRAIGESSICMALCIEAVDYKTIVEPHLLRLGLIARTSRGRVLTIDGIDYLNK